MTWGFENSGPCSGAFNMLRDRELAQLVSRGEIPATLRLYAWRPYAVSYGFHQHEDEFDTAKLKAEGIDLVQRPTGGKAILHAEELTYCAVLPMYDRSPRELYEFINKGLLAGVQNLGIKAHLTEQNVSLTGGFADPSMVACFSSSARSEVLVGTRKILGSAQRRLGSVILQHGSLLLGPAHREIVNYLAAKDEPRLAAIRERLEGGAIDAFSVLQSRITYDEAVAAIRKGFEDALTVEFQEIEAAISVPH
jgi:lipoate-protein ligase A